MRKELRLKNDLDELQKIKDAIALIFEGHPARETAEFELNLIAEELFTNVINHAFHDNAPHEILIEVAATGKDWEIRIEDDGTPFDPTRAPDADTNAPLEERSIGGLGIHLVRRMSDVFEYENKNGRNIVRVRKQLIRD